MRFGVRSWKLAVSAISMFLGGSLAAQDERSSDTIMRTALALAGKDWEALQESEPAVIFRQSTATPVIGEAAELEAGEVSDFLSDCRFVAMQADVAGALRLPSDDDKAVPPLTKLLAMWICDRATPVEVELRASDDGTLVTLRKRPVFSRSRIEQFRTSGSNARLAEGLATASLSEPDFAVGSPPKREKVLPGEPSHADVTNAALQYITAIGEDAEGDWVGLDLLDYGRMNWKDKKSREFQKVSFAEIKRRLEPCKLFEGWPRRYDRDEKRVLAFDSGWRCLGGQGPYSITLFLEVADGQVAGGRLIQKSSREDRPALAVPVPVAPN